MKTLRLAMVAVIIACTMVSLASTDNFKISTKKVIYMTFEKAIQNPGLVVAMHQQLTPDFLAKEKPMYVVSVSYNGNTYRISGTREQWVKFLIPKWKIISESKPGVTGEH